MMTAIDIYQEAYEQIVTGRNDQGALIDSLYRLSQVTDLAAYQLGVWTSVLVTLHVERLNNE